MEDVRTTRIKDGVFLKGVWVSKENFDGMLKSTTVRARLELKLKKETELLLVKLGINTTEAIRVLFI